MRTLYADITRRKELTDEGGAASRHGNSGPELTTAAIVHAIAAPYPRPRYVVGATPLGLPAVLLLRLQWLLPTPAMDRFLLRCMQRREIARLSSLPARQLSPV